MDPVPAQSSRTTSPGTPSPPTSPTVVLEPTTVTVPENVPWYKRLFGGGTHTQNVWRLSFVVMFLLAVMVTLKIHQPQVLTTKAGGNKARVTLVPKQANVPSETFVQLWITADASVTRAQAMVSFDPKKVVVVDVKPPTESPFTGSVTTNPLDAANKTGIVSIVFNPQAGKVTPPSGTFELVNMIYRRKASTVTGTTQVTLLPNAVILYHDSVPFVVTTSAGSTLMLGAGK